MCRFCSDPAGAYDDLPDATYQSIFGQLPISRYHDAAEHAAADLMSDVEAAAYVASLPPGQVFIDGVADHRSWQNLRSQAMRTYVYRLGNKYTVLGPQLMHQNSDGTQLVYDDSGRSHEIAAGYTAITWSTKPGQPNFPAQTDDDDEASG